MHPLLKRTTIALATAMLAMLSSVAAFAGSATVSEAFVTNQNGDSLTIVSLADMKALAEIPIGGKPAGIAMSPDGKFAYLTSPDSKELVVVDAAARKVARRLRVGEAPLGIAAHPTNGRVYVADWYTHKI
jgi:YVTN family beta-propeller protein